MSTGNVSLDILLDEILENAIANSEAAISSIMHRYPKLTKREAEEIFRLICASNAPEEKAISLVTTAPPSFALKTKSTKIVVSEMISHAEKSILITGYSLSDYFNDLIDSIILKSQRGVLVKFFVNNIDNQKNFDKLCRYRGKFLRIYNYPKQNDSMSALHAKVISVDTVDTLITSANLSYHGQEGNIELGTHIISSSIAKQIDDVFTKLLFQKVFLEIK